MTYFLLKHKRLWQQNDNLKIYMIYKKSEQERLQREMDLETRHEPISRMQFWWRYLSNDSSNRFYELSYFTYLMSKFRFRSYGNEEENVDPNVMLDNIDLEGGRLRVGGQSMLEILERQKNISIIDGRVQTIAKFGNKVQHADIVEAKALKSLRSDVTVLCSGYYFLNQLVEVYIHLPVVRTSTELLLRTGNDLTNKLCLYNGPSSIQTPDRLPLVGRPAQLTNLFFLTGF